MGKKALLFVLTASLGISGCIVVERPSPPVQQEDSSEMFQQQLQEQMESQRKMQEESLRKFNETAGKMAIEHQKQSGETLRQMLESN